MLNVIEQSYYKLKDYCEAENFMGWDPFDGLNSKVYKAIPFISSSRFIRLGFIQLFKRSPINLRKILLVPKGYNSKGLGLFLAGYCKEYKFNPTDPGKAKIDHLIKLLLENQTTQYSGSCWGYNFDWQARAFFQPKNTPTVVASVFIASALLDAYEITKDESLLLTARSTCDFILKDLHRTYDDEGNFSFSYSPLDQSVVFNASLLGSRLLARVYSFTHEEELIEAAKKSVAYSCRHQQADGSWGYGILSYHQWVDSFHTGYNLECISDYMKFSGDNSYKANLKKGFEYYVNSFFTDEGIPKYYNNSIYPIDVHSPAQLTITLAKLDESVDHKPLLDKVLLWTIENMQSPKGYFYYQVNKIFTSKIPYIRWTQAWMFYALTTYIYEKPGIEIDQI